MLKLLFYLAIIGLGIALIVEFIKLLIEFIIAILPVILIILAVAAVAWGCYKIAKHKKNKTAQAEHQEIPQDLATLLNEGRNLTITTKQQLQDFYDSQVMLKSFITRVVGVSYPNDDGSSRQEILSHCLTGEPVGFYWHDFRGTPACAVISFHGQIGYLKAELAADLYEQYVAEDTENLITFMGKISDITVGDNGLSYGCNIRIDIYKEADETAAPEQPKPDPSSERPVARPAPTPAAPPIKQRRSKPPVMEEESQPELPPGPHDWLRSHETLDHYIVLDIETTGFSKENDRIIELAAIHYVYGVESDTFCTYIDPEREIPKHITALTGIRDSDVANAPLISSIKRDFLRFIQDYPLVGHNIKEFDLPFLSTQLDIVIPNTTIDTLELARDIFPETPTHKLSDLNEWLHLHEGTSHRAAEDVTTTNELLWACLYPEKYQDFYQEGIQNGFPKPEHSAKKSYVHRKDSISATQICPTQAVDPNSPLYGKRIVFTGELSIPRKEAMQIAANAGALLRTSVSGKTDYLVVGKQDPAVVGTDGLSNKQRKAKDLNEAGCGHIVIVDENEFLTLVPN